jgi:hypothetical protein
MEDPDPTLEALVEASNYPISIVMIGVGDGPWGLMEDCDDLLPSRKFDNFQVSVTLSVTLSVTRDVISRSMGEIV